MNEWKLFMAQKYKELASCCILIFSALERVKTFIQNCKLSQTEMTD